MTFSERMKEMLEQGWAASKELAAKAGAKAQDLGERGLLMLEIKQLEGLGQKLLTRLGNEVYTAFEEQGNSSIDQDDAKIKPILEELTQIKESIERKETELKNR